MATLQLTGTPDTPSNLAGSFGAASAVVIAGVLAAWVFVKQDSALVPEAMPDQEALVSTQPALHSQPTIASLLEQAEIAFAAGRIIEPEFDNALNYYLSLLEAEPDNAEAAQGVDRVMAYLQNQAEGAIFQNDWDSARAYAEVVLNVRPNDTDARDLRARADRFERVETLTAQALDQFSRGSLVSPKDGNAAASYRTILELDPVNAVAQQGLRSIVQRLLANAQSAAFAGEPAAAQKFIAEARAIDPSAPGLVAVEKSSRQIKRVVEGGNQQSDLLAAAEALQADRLMPPATPNAFDLFNAVLARDPESEAARRGLALVRDALLDRAAAQTAAGSLDQAGALLAQATAAGADAQRIAQLQGDVKYQQRLQDARAGRFERRYAVSELSATRQVAPSYPRTAAARKLAGWVEVEFTVTESGDVRDAKVSDSSAALFESSALSAIARWRFEPVLEDGHPVPVRVVVKFNFKN
jgi:TonB family protein